MRKASLWILSLLLIACGAKPRPLSLRDLEGPITRAVFDNRSLKPPAAVSMRAGLATLTSSESKALVDAYTNIIDRSLIIRTTAVVDHLDFQHDPGDLSKAPGDWSFPRLIARALGQVGYSADVQSAVQSLSKALTLSNFDTAWGDADSQYKLGKIPLRLLAVVNRMDLAHQSVNCDPDKLCGAEFRFVYAGIVEPPCQKDQPCPKPELTNPYFTLILEFVLPPMTEDQLRQADSPWADLNSQDDPNLHRAALEKVLAGSYQLWAQATSPMARVRVNSRNDDGGLWTFGQYLLTAHGFQYVPMDQQFSGDTVITQCVKRTDALGKFLMHPKQQALVLTTDYNFFKPPGDCLTSGALKACAATTDRHPVSALTLATGVAPGAASVDELRYALSINSCTGCHGHEAQGTATDPDPRDQYGHFDQIKYRNYGEQSRLSRFLAGGPGGKPVLPSAGGWTVTPPTLPDCGPPVATRTFNDLLRRVIFHFFLLIFKIRIGVPVGPAFTPVWTHLSANGLSVTQVH